MRDADPFSLSQVSVKNIQDRLCSSMISFTRKVFLDSDLTLKSAIEISSTSVCILGAFVSIVIKFWLFEPCVLSRLGRLYFLQLCRTGIFCGKAEACDCHAFT